MVGPPLYQSVVPGEECHVLTGFSQSILEPSLWSGGWDYEDWLNASQIPLPELEKIRLPKPHSSCMARGVGRLLGK